MGNDETDDSTVVGYVRTHDLDLERQPLDYTSIEAKVLNIHVIGPVVRVSLAIEESQQTLEAELTRDVFQNLNLQKNERIFVRPRHIRVFKENYQI